MQVWHDFPWACSLNHPRPSHTFLRGAVNPKHSSVSQLGESPAVDEPTEGQPF